MSSEITSAQGSLQKRASSQYRSEEQYQESLMALLAEQDGQCGNCGLHHLDWGGGLSTPQFSAHHILWAHAYGTHHHHNRIALCLWCHNHVIHGDRKTGPAYGVRKSEASGLNPSILRRAHSQHDFPHGEVLVVPFREAWSSLPPEIIEEMNPVGRADEYEQRMTEADYEAFRQCRSNWDISDFYTC